MGNKHSTQPVQQLEKPQVTQFVVQGNFDALSKTEIKKFMVGFLLNNDLDAAMITDVDLGDKSNVKKIFEKAQAEVEGNGEKTETCTICARVNTNKNINNLQFYILKERPKFDTYFQALFKPFQVTDGVLFVHNTNEFEIGIKLDRLLPGFFDTPEVTTLTFHHVDTSKFTFLRAKIEEIAKTFDAQFETKSRVYEGSKLNVTISKRTNVITPPPSEETLKKSGNSSYTY